MTSTTTANNDSTLIANEYEDCRMIYVELLRALHVMEQETSRRISDQVPPSWYYARISYCQSLFQQLLEFQDNQERHLLPIDLHSLQNRVDQACQHSEQIVSAFVGTTKSSSNSNDPNEPIRQLIFAPSQTICKQTSARQRENKAGEFPIAEETSIKNGDDDEEEEQQTRNNDDDDDTSQNDGSKMPAPVVSPQDLQEQQREQMEEAIREMAAQMKEETARIHQTLRNQTADLDELEDVTTKNVEAVTKVAQDVDEHVRQGWIKSIGTWTMLFVMAGAFCFTLIVILMAPKRRDAPCLFFCGRSDVMRRPVVVVHHNGDKFCRTLPDGTHECLSEERVWDQQQRKITEESSDQEYQPSEDYDDYSGDEGLGSCQLDMNGECEKGAEELDKLELDQYLDQTVVQQDSNNDAADYVRHTSQENEVDHLDLQLNSAIEREPHNAHETYYSPSEEDEDDDEEEEDDDDEKDDDDDDDVHEHMGHDEGQAAYEEDEGWGYEESDEDTISTDGGDQNGLPYDEHGEIAFNERDEMEPNLDKHKEVDDSDEKRIYERDGQESHEVLSHSGYSHSTENDAKMQEMQEQSDEDDETDDANILAEEDREWRKESEDEKEASNNQSSNDNNIDTDDFGILDDENDEPRNDSSENHHDSKKEDLVQQAGNGYGSDADERGEEENGFNLSSDHDDDGSWHQNDDGGDVDEHDDTNHESDQDHHYSTEGQQEHVHDRDQFGAIDEGIQETLPYYEGVDQERVHDHLHLEDGCTFDEKEYPSHEWKEDIDQFADDQMEEHQHEGGDDGIATEKEELDHNRKGGDDEFLDEVEPSVEEQIIDDSIGDDDYNNSDEKYYSGILDSHEDHRHAREETDDERGSGKDEKDQIFESDRVYHLSRDHKSEQQESYYEHEDENFDIDPDDGSDISPDTGAIGNERNHGNDASFQIEDNTDFDRVQQESILDTYEDHVTKDGNVDGHDRYDSAEKETYSQSEDAYIDMNDIDEDQVTKDENMQEVLNNHEASAEQDNLSQSKDASIQKEYDQNFDDMKEELLHDREEEDLAQEADSQELLVNGSAHADMEYIWDSKDTHAEEKKTVETESDSEDMPYTNTEEEEEEVVAAEWDHGNSVDTHAEKEETVDGKLDGQRSLDTQSEKDETGEAEWNSNHRSDTHAEKEKTGEAEWDREHSLDTHAEEDEHLSYEQDDQEDLGFVEGGLEIHQEHAAEHDVLDIATEDDVHSIGSPQSDDDAKDMLDEFLNQQQQHQNDGSSAVDDNTDSSTAHPKPSIDRSKEQELLDQTLDDLLARAREQENAQREDNPENTRHPPSDDENDGNSVNNNERKRHHDSELPNAIHQQRFEQVNDPFAEGNIAQADVHAEIPFFKGLPFSPQDVRRAAAAGDLEALEGYLEIRSEWCQDYDKNGWTAWHLAARTGNTAVIAILKKAHGGVSDLKTNDGRTALDVAIGNWGHDHPVTEMLSH